MIKKILLSIFLITLLAVVGTAIWMSIAFEYQQNITAKALESTDQVTVINNEFIEFAPTATNDKVGLIFYPGGKTAAETFAPLMQLFAEQGIYTVITPMPLKTAFLGIDKANDVIAANPTIKQWYIAGHSLGGVAAAEYVKAAPKSVKGLLLWASYPGSDISTLKLAVHSLSAEKDLQSTPEKIVMHKTKLPVHTVYQVIESANHWQYGHYQDELNEQQNLISRTEQQHQILAATLAFIDQNIAK